jgi:hypothetical protein
VSGISELIEPGPKIINARGEPRRRQERQILPGQHQRVLADI